MKKLFFILIGLIWFVFYAKGQKINDFSLKNVQNGKTVRLSDFNSKKAVVLIFTSNVCPYSVYYEGRITQLVSEYKNKDIQFVLINSQTEDKESEAEMANKISTWGLQVPYLADKDQSVLRAFKASKSPEVFLLRTNGNEFTIFYQGAIDNNPQVATDVKEQYLKNNIEQLLSGKSPARGGRPIGCMVKRN